MPLLRIEQISSPQSSRKFKKVIICLCDVCECEFARSFAKKEAERAKIHSYCSVDCKSKAQKVGGLIDIKRRETCIERYGVEHQSKNNEVIEKITKSNKQTCLERYGVENFGCIPSAREKSRETMIERYGVEHSYHIDIAASKQKAKESLLQNYGVAYPMQSAEILEKRKQTCLERYGVENSAQSTISKEKYQATMLARYGVTNPLKLEATRQKSNQACLEKYGVEYASQTQQAKDTAKKTCLERYGVENQMQSDLIKEKVRQTNLEKYGVTSFLHTPEIRKKVRQINGIGVSKKETAFFEKLAHVFKKVDRHITVCVGKARREIDFYIHDIDCYVNYNGVYWHGKNKTEEELKKSSTTQADGIVRNKRYDAELISWFEKQRQQFVVVWEDEESIGLEILTSMKNLAVETEQEVAVTDM